MMTPSERLETEMLREQLAWALDELESMVTQALSRDGDGDFDAMHMATYESACDALAELRPDNWERTRLGVRMLG